MADPIGSSQFDKGTWDLDERLLLLAPRGDGFSGPGCRCAGRSTGERSSQSVCPCLALRGRYQQQHGQARAVASARGRQVGVHVRGPVRATRRPL